jgi:adenylate cyclase class 2
MALEIEAKLKVESLASVAERLRVLGARLMANKDQEDLYFDNAQAQMVAEDKCLRIRIETADKVTKTSLTYKGPKQESDLKCREEIEMRVSGSGQPKALLLGLGYEQILTVLKHRSLWFHKQCLICLDQVTDLGSFVEIEGPSSDVIYEVQKDLELDHIPHCQESYACLLAESQKLNTENHFDMKPEMARMYTTL